MPPVSSPCRRATPRSLTNSDVFIGRLRRMERCRLPAQLRNCLYGTPTAAAISGPEYLPSMRITISTRCLGHGRPIYFTAAPTVVLRTADPSPNRKMIAVAGSMPDANRARHPSASARLERSIDDAQNAVGRDGMVRFGGDKALDVMLRDLVDALSLPRRHDGVREVRLVSRQDRLPFAFECWTSCSARLSTESSARAIATSALASLSAPSSSSPTAAPRDSATSRRRSPAGPRGLPSGRRPEPRLVSVPCVDYSVGNRGNGLG
jgi:hypothetical protein